MNKKYRWGAAAAVLLLAFVIGYSWFHVSGREIASLTAMDEDCEVVIVRHDLLANEPQREYTLAGPQITELKELLQQSSYTRRLTFLDGFSYDPVSYSISIYFDGRQEVLFLNCVGGENLFVSSSFEEKDHYDLKINRGDWKESLEKILAASEPWPA